MPKTLLAVLNSM